MAIKIIIVFLIMCFVAFLMFCIGMYFQIYHPPKREEDTFTYAIDKLGEAHRNLILEIIKVLHLNEIEEAVDNFIRKVIKHGDQ